MDRLIPAKGERVPYLIEFFKHHAIACLFPFSIVASLAFTKVVHIPGLPRYDFLLILCLAIQALMVKFKLESWRDAAVVAVFHLLGLALEIYKVNQGSWSYPEFAYTKIAGAPLYSGFMHGSVASFMCLAWKGLDLKCSQWPSPLKTGLIATALYALFFYPADGSHIRLVTLGLILIVFIDSKVHYTINNTRYQMQMPISFLLIGSMIYTAENIATYLGAWRYPYQLESWQPVHSGKIVSWTLLMIVSLIIVAEYKRTLGHLIQKNGVTEPGYPVDHAAA